MPWRCSMDGLQAWQAAGQAVGSGKSSRHFQSNFELGQPLETRSRP